MVALSKFFSQKISLYLKQSELNRQKFHSKLYHWCVFLDEHGVKRKQCCFKFEKFLTDEFPK